MWNGCNLPSSLPQFWGAVKVTNATNFPSIDAKSSDVLLWNQSFQDLKNTCSFTSQLPETISELRCSRFLIRLLSGKHHWPTMMRTACLLFFPIKYRGIYFGKPNFYGLKNRRYLYNSTQEKLWLVGPRVLRESGLKNQVASSPAFWVSAKAMEERGAAAQMFPGTQLVALITGNGRWKTTVAPVEATDGDHRGRGRGTCLSCERGFLKDN